MLDGVTNKVGLEDLNGADIENERIGIYSGNGELGCGAGTDFINLVQSPHFYFCLVLTFTFKEIAKGFLNEVGKDFAKVFKVTKNQPWPSQIHIYSKDEDIKIRIIIPQNIDQIDLDKVINTYLSQLHGPVDQVLSYNPVHNDLTLLYEYRFKE